MCESRSLLIKSLPNFISFLSTDAAKDFFLKFFRTDLLFKSDMPLGLTLEHATIKPVISSHASKYLSRLVIHSFPHLE